MADAAAVHRLLLIALALSAPAGWLAAPAIARFAPALRKAVLTPSVAGLFAALAGWAAIETSGWVFVGSLLLGWTLAVLAIVDLAVFRLPDVFTWPLAAAGLAVSLPLPAADPAAHLVGAVAGWLAFFAIGLAYRRLRGREGLGAGDAKLMAAAGAWLGWAPLFSVVLIGCLAALLLAAVQSALRRREAGAPLPFGPPLCLGIWIVWLHGPLSLGGG